MKKKIFYQAFEHGLSLRFKINSDHAEHNEKC